MSRASPCLSVALPSQSYCSGLDKFRKEKASQVHLSLWKQVVLSPLLQSQHFTENFPACPSRRCNSRVKAGSTPACVWDNLVLLLPCASSPGVPHPYESSGRCIACSSELMPLGVATQQKTPQATRKPAAGGPNGSSDREGLSL